MTPSRPRVALTIAGSDSGGGAGIQADLKTFEAFGVFGTTAITAVTAQNTVGVECAVALPPELVTAQMEAVTADLHPSAAKTGMLANAQIVHAVAESVERLALAPLVVDPVMVATSGDRLLEADATDLLTGRLLPLATIVTPNLAEAELMTGRAVRDRAAMAAAARLLVDRGAGAALVKGGHLEGDRVLDLLWDGTEEHIFEATRIPTTSTHGTGCTLSAAITAGLASGRGLVDAVDVAIHYTRRAIEAAPGLGAGRGPLDHRRAGRSTGQGDPQGGQENRRSR
ncbi:MAG: bifunctional hydroxymethylpyrimidine kinase/phosphomethylpyrimidine kinase [Gemmatimonadota bacterium]|nr:bifunctional hydroxymethylpyrimidine kinase/phosphomethylpyrimidine kinase [Gemmatimonadota bacterium]